MIIDLRTGLMPPSRDGELSPNVAIIVIRDPKFQRLPSGRFALYNVAVDAQTGTATFNALYDGSDFSVGYRSLTLCLATAPSVADRQPTLGLAGPAELSVGWPTWSSEIQAILVTSVQALRAGIT
ncbi:MAG: hypothetical protein LBH76_10545 [Propionibacteriaceae bacterium]|jgi:hypothetical protein|nr:hypothetical protein [Propionibacteriaceae bacterium]